MANENLPPPYYSWPIGKDGVERVADRLAKRAAAYWLELGRSFTEDMPFLKQPTGREALAFYETTDLQWWLELAYGYTDEEGNVHDGNFQEAQYQMRRWGSLVNLYGAAEVQMPVYSNGNGVMA